MQSDSRVVVLGASGFLGSALTDYLKTAHGRAVVGFSFPTVDFRDYEQTINLKNEIFHSDTLIFCAALKRQFGDTLASFNSNLKIARNVAALLRLVKPRTVLYMSSAAVYGEDVTNLNISESAPLTPTSYYGLSKLAAEFILHREYASLPDARLVILRPPLIFGPGDQAATYGPVGFLESARCGVPVELWGDGTENRDFLFVDDFCAVVNELLESDFRGVINVATGEAATFLRITEILKRFYPTLKLTSKKRTKVKSDHRFDNKLLRANLPPSFAFTSLEDAIAKFVSRSINQ